MRRIPDEDDHDVLVPGSSKSLIIPVIGVLFFGFCLYWAWNHVSNGCTGFEDVFTYCSGKTGSVVITK